MTGGNWGRIWGVDLYNLKTLVHTLTPAMLALPDPDPRKKPEFPSGAPVVEIVGDRAAGKTTALNALYERYRRHAPIAYVDLAEAPYTAVDPADRESLDEVNASPITNLLYTISYKLSMQPDKGQALTFPRLSPALLVITAWNPEPPEPGAPARPADLLEAERKVRDILTTQAPPDPNNKREALERWLNAVNGVAAGLLPDVPGLKEVLDAATAPLLERKAHGPRLAWWRTQLVGQAGDAVQRLFNLAQQFHDGGVGRAQVEARLIAALLADIDAAYNWWARLTRYQALVLLDNVDDALRERFLQPLVAEYKKVTRQRGWFGRTMRPVVFTTSLGNGSDPKLTPVTVEAPWKSEELCPPASWQLRLGIPRVNDGEIGTMLGNASHPQALRDIILRLSGGRAGSALLLAEAAATGLQKANRSVPGWLLSLPSPEPVRGDQPGEIAERLLEQLLPDSDVRKQLIDLAPALDEKAAALSGLPRPDAGDSPALAVRELIDGTLALKHWQHRPWPLVYGDNTPLVTDRALRALLLHRLRAQGSREHWTHIHRRLASQYNPQQRPPDWIEHEPRYLHHALALGELDSLVVRAMHYRYLRLAPAVWLRDVNLVAAAPPAFGGFTSGQVSSEQQCSACDTPKPDQVHVAIRNLLATVWRLSAPESERPSGHKDPDVGLIDSALRTLQEDYARRRPHGDDTYLAARSQGGWIDALLKNTQAPDLPVQERSG